MLISFQQKNKYLQNSIEASGGAAVKKNLRVTSSLTTAVAAPAAEADAIQVEGSAADPLHNETAKTGTLVRIHGLTDELRRLNFDKVSVLVTTVLCVNFWDTFANCAAREWCATLTQLGDAIESGCCKKVLLLRSHR